MKYLKWTLALLILLIINPSFSQDGEKIFRSNCASCHAYGRKLVGPDLTGVTEIRDHEWLKKWIKSSSTLIKEGDQTAVQLFNDNNKVPMPDAFISDSEMDALLAYMKTKTADAVATADGGSGTEIATTSAVAETNTLGSMLNSYSFTEYMLFSLICLFIVVIFIMSRTIRSLSRRLTDEFESKNW